MLHSLIESVYQKKTLSHDVVWRLEHAQYGDFKLLGGGVSEFRFFLGAGYRIYDTERDAEITILLCGGDKSSQVKDVARAKALCSELEA